MVSFIGNIKQVLYLSISIYLFLCLIYLWFSIFSRHLIFSVSVSLFFLSFYLYIFFSFSLSLLSFLYAYAMYLSISLYLTRNLNPTRTGLRSSSPGFTPRPTNPMPSTSRMNVSSVDLSINLSISLFEELIL